MYFIRANANSVYAWENKQTFSQRFGFQNAPNASVFLTNKNFTHRISCV